MRLRGFVHQGLYPVSIFSKIEMFSVQWFNIDSSIDMRTHALDSRTQFLIEIVAPNVPQKALITTLSAKRLQLLGDEVTQTPTMFHISAKLNNFHTSHI